MKLLITGICGFAGFEITKRLREQFPGDMLQIRGMDNLSRRGSWRNIRKLTEFGVDVQHGDIRIAADLECIDPVDWIIDASADASVLAGISNRSSSRRLTDNNLVTTINLLECCRTFSAGFILLSTSRVYSISPLSDLTLTAINHRFELDSEQTLPFGLTSDGITATFSTASPVSLYGATKLASEQLAIEYGMTFDFPVWVNRCGVLAGAGQFGKADQGIFSFWLHSWRENRSLTYIGFDGQGHQVRDCLHPRDLTELISKQLRCENDQRPIIGNVSGGLDSSRSLAELSNWCSERWGSRKVRHDASPRRFDLPWIVLDSSEVRKNWDWRPNSTTESILCEIAEFADAHPDWLCSIV